MLMEDTVNKRPVILDCDPGHDDALALFMLANNPKVDLLAVTTSAGNQTQDKTFHNAAALLNLAGRTNVPIARGAEKPLIGELVIADSVHGESGVDGATLPSYEPPTPHMRALDLMSRTIEDSVDPVTLVATGPLTNVALLCATRPDLSSKLESITFMGGAAFGGNWSSHAEFNIYVDPEAAQIVFQSGVKLNMFGLDVTLKAQLFKEHIEVIRAMGSPVATVMADLLDYFNTKVSQPFLAPEGHVEGLHLHDPCAAAYVIAPELFLMRELYGAIDTRQGATRGMTQIDYLGRTKRSPNVNVSFDIDLAGMQKLVINSIARYGTSSVEGVK